MDRVAHLVQQALQHGVLPCLVQVAVPLSRALIQVKRRPSSCKFTITTRQLENGNVIRMDKDITRRAHSTFSHSRHLHQRLQASAGLEKLKTIVYRLSSIKHKYDMIKSSEGSRSAAHKRQNLLAAFLDALHDECALLGDYALDVQVVHARVHVALHKRASVIVLNIPHPPV